MSYAERATNSVCDDLHRDLLSAGVDKSSLLPEALRHLRRDGVCVIDDVLAPALVATPAAIVRAIVEDNYTARMEEAERRAAAGETRIDVWPDERGVVRVCLDIVDNRFRSLVTHPLVATAASELLGPDWEVSGMELRVPLPGFGHQGLHQDIESPTDATIWQRVRMTWVLSAFTVETGTYRFIPGSHLTGPPAETGIGMPPHPDEVRVIAAPGAIVLKSAHVWHSGTFNASAEPRLSIDIDYRSA